MCLFACVQVISAVVTVNGEVEFVGNDAKAHGGAALHISSFGQLRMNRYSSMNFENNIGRWVVQACGVCRVLECVLCTWCECVVCV